MVTITAIVAMRSVSAADSTESMTNEIIPKQLQRHVFHLATTIGERNVFRPQALHDAQAYIDEIWRSQGYEVIAQSIPESLS